MKLFNTSITKLQVYLIEAFQNQKNVKYLNLVKFIGKKELFNY